jgi:hypothetical protein
MRMKKNYKLGILTSILLIIITTPALFSMTTAVTASHPANAMWITPSQIELNVTLISTGYKFNVTIWANCSVNCGAWQFWLTYPKTYINATRAGYTAGTKSEFFQGINTIPVNPSFKSHNATHNRVEYGESWAGTGSLRSPGSGSLCWIEFNVTTLPTSSVNVILNFYAYTGTIKRTYLINGDTGEKVTLTAYTGLVKFLAPTPPTPKYTLTITSTTGGTTNPPPATYIYEEGETATVQALPNSGYMLDHWELDAMNVGPTNPIDVLMDTNHTLHAVFTRIPPPTGTRIFVDPPEIIDPTMVPSSEFSINITVDDVADLKTCIFNLTYNQGIIGVIGMRFFKVQSQYPTPMIIIDDEAGYIWMKLTYASSLMTTDPLPLVRIDFHVEALGATPLDLNGTYLLNSDGEPMDHNATDGFFMSLIRDIAILDIEVDRNWAYKGWPVDIAVKVKNKGNISETFDLRAYYDGNLIGQTTVNDLAPNEIRDVIFTWDTSSVGGGNYTIRAEADTLPYEVNVSDNTFTDGKVLIMTQIHDVAITSVSLPGNWAYQGWIVKITVTVKNKGNLTESFNLEMYYDTNLFANLTIENLPANNEQILVINWNTSTVTPCHNYTISARIPPLEYEYNTSDNEYVAGKIKIRVFGDVTGDGEVSIDDIFATANAFGSYPGHPRWNEYADVNQDEYVGIDDIFLVARSFGNSCS